MITEDLEVPSNCWLKFTGLNKARTGIKENLPLTIPQPRGTLPPFPLLPCRLSLLDLSRHNQLIQVQQESFIMFYKKSALQHQRAQSQAGVKAHMFMSSFRKDQTQVASQPMQFPA